MSLTQVNDYLSIDKQNVMAASSIGDGGKLVYEVARSALKLTNQV
jgi:hypothetical protein